MTALDSQGRPIDVTSVTGSLSSDDAGIAALRVKFSAARDGEWHSTYAVVPLPGWWTLNLKVELSTNDAIAAVVCFTVGPM